MNQSLSKLTSNCNKKWLITGVAGFVGSNLLEFLLRSGQDVVGVDNFLTGKIDNLEEVKNLITKENWKKFKFIEGDIKNLNTCKLACNEGIDFILHQAALGSVPRSISDPISVNENNISGFLNVLEVAKRIKIKKFIYASSSSVYGDNFSIPKVEDKIGNPLSPYAITKVTNENYAKNFTALYGIPTVGLRYFNVFGPRQDPYGEYSAVIPRWINDLINDRKIIINGDGTTTRDFCYIDNVIQANILACLTNSKEVNGQVFNIACAESISLNELYAELKHQLIYNKIKIRNKPIYGPFREGDIKVSLASINKAKLILNYNPKINIRSGIVPTVKYYLEKFAKLK